MAIQVQYRRGTGAENDIFTGALAEITIDTTNKTLRVHDGVTAGGSNIATVAYVDEQIGGNVTALINGTSTVGIPVANGNVTVGVAGISNVAVFSATGADITGTFGATGNITGGNMSAVRGAFTTVAGTLETAAQPNVTSVGTLSSLSVSGNATAANFVGTLNGSGANVTSINADNISSGTLNQTRLANAAVTLGSTALTLGDTVTSIAGLSSVTSTTFVGALTGAATTAGTVTTNAQPNITSVGTLSVLSVTGNTTSGNFVTAGSVDAGTLQTTGTAIIGGNLVVNGNTISVNIDDLHVQDPVIGLGRGPNNAALITNDGKARGSQLWYYDTDERSAFIGYNTATGKLLAAANVSISNELVTVNNLGSFVVGAVEAITVSASGNVTAGNVSGATGAFTTVTGNGRALTSLNASNIDTGTLPSARLSGTYTITVSGSATTAGTVTTAAQPNITSVGTLTALAVTGNTTSGNFVGTLNGSGANVTSINATNIASGTLAVARGGTGVTTSTGTGAVVLDTSPTFTTQITVPSIVKSGTNAVGNIGQTDNRFNNVFARASSASYADLAEIYLTDGDYPAGTVVIFGGTKEVTESNQYADSRLAGVISTNPAFVMNDGAEGQPVALQGRVPCRVVGDIVKGDLITTSDVPGVATRLDSNDWQPGTVLGKALENYNSTEPGVIEVVVGRV
jgi:hypothetical protein